MSRVRLLRLVAHSIIPLRGGIQGIGTASHWPDCRAGVDPARPGPPRGGCQRTGRTNVDHMSKSHVSGRADCTIEGNGGTHDLPEVFGVISCSFACRRGKDRHIGIAPQDMTGRCKYTVAAIVDQTAMHRVADGKGLHHRLDCCQPCTNRIARRIANRNRQQPGAITARDFCVRPAADRSSKVSLTKGEQQIARHGRVGQGRCLSGEEAERVNGRYGPRQDQRCNFADAAAKVPTRSYAACDQRLSGRHHECGERSRAIAAASVLPASGKEIAQWA